MAVINKGSGDFTTKQKCKLLWESRQLDTRTIAKRISKVVDRHRSLSRNKFAELRSKGWDNPYHYLPYHYSNNWENFIKNKKDEGWEEQLRVIMNTNTGRIRVVEKMNPSMRKNEVIAFGVRVWHQRITTPHGTLSRGDVRFTLTHPSTVPIPGVKSDNCGTILSSHNDYFHIDMIALSLNAMFRQWFNNDEMTKA